MASIPANHQRVIEQFVSSIENENLHQDASDLFASNATFYGGKNFHEEVQKAVTKGRAAFSASHPAKQEITDIYVSTRSGSGNSRYIVTVRASDNEERAAEITIDSSSKIRHYVPFYAAEGPKGQ